MDRREPTWPDNARHVSAVYCTDGDSTSAGDQSSRRGRLGGERAATRDDRVVARASRAGWMHDKHHKRLFVFPHMVEDLLRGFVRGE